MLSFNALSNGKSCLIKGQLAFSLVTDPNFKTYTWRKNLRTLLSLYRISTVANQEIELIFDGFKVSAITDAQGCFATMTQQAREFSALKKITTTKGIEILPVKGLYPLSIKRIVADTMIVSDLDDTFFHSFVRNKGLPINKVRPLLAEERKATDGMLSLLKELTRSGAEVCYLSGSEQNLYPVACRFLRLNNFPEGPLFLNEIRSLSDILLNKPKNKHDKFKIGMLEQLIRLFHDKKFIFIGDNTRDDLRVYLKTAEKFPEQIRHIIIRKAFDKRHDEVVIKHAEKLLQQHNINFQYADRFPETLKSLSV